MALLKLLTQSQVPTFSDSESLDHLQSVTEIVQKLQGGSEQWEQCSTGANKPTESSREHLMPLILDMVQEIGLSTQFDNFSKKKKKKTSTLFNVYIFIPISFFYLVLF